MVEVEKYREHFLKYMNEKVDLKEPKNLYEPILYILNLGGKRLRPILTLLATDAFEGDVEKALDAALAIEIFHNFSLVHDDIMDDAPLRRGKDTVHEKWDINTGILSGDAMLINAYQLFENYDSDTFKQLAQLFTKTAIEVCEGQQYDVDYEESDLVSIPEYLQMIKYKTAVLVGAALQMGAIIANASKKDEQLIYDFGCNLGLAFQLQDDYLDVFGNPETFGKQIGGDIIENKKTFLYLKSLELLDQDESEQLKHLYSISPLNPAQKIETVGGLFVKSGAAGLAKQEIEKYTSTALKHLQDLEMKPEKKQRFTTFANDLMTRNV